MSQFYPVSAEDQKDVVTRLLEVADPPEIVRMVSGGVQVPEEVWSLAFGDVAKAAPDQPSHEPDGGSPEPASEGGNPEPANDPTLGGSEQADAAELSGDHSDPDPAPARPARKTAARKS